MIYCNFQEIIIDCFFIYQALDDLGAVNCVDSDDICLLKLTSSSKCIQLSDVYTSKTLSGVILLSLHSFLESTLFWILSSCVWQMESSHKMKLSYLATLATA